MPADSTFAVLSASTSFLSPKTVGESPFFAPLEERLSTKPPSIASALWRYSICTKQAINTRIIGFGEPSLSQCSQDLVTAMTASMSSAEAPSPSLKQVLTKRRGTVDVSTLPWEPREAYRQWLQRSGRLPD